MCFYCGAPVRDNVEYDHFPIPKACGGEQVIPCCISCHDMKDRFPMSEWPPEWIDKIIDDFPYLSRETKLFLAKSMKLYSEYIDSNKNRS